MSFRDGVKDNDVSDKWREGMRNAHYKKQIEDIIHLLARQLQYVIDTAHDPDVALQRSIDAFENMSNLIAEICKEIGRRERPI